MGHFLEASVTLLPADAGGRTSPISPRDGSYCPFAAGAGGERLRIRVIEGPPSIAPGHEGRVVAEIESPIADDSLIIAGAEFELIEYGRCVGILTVSRFCRAVSV